ncbi:MAG: GNAT family N-acetyltransferase, partial [Bdellovibrionota bacterium]
AASFLDRTSDLLLAAELENNLLLSSALALSKSGVTRLPSLSFFTVFRGEEPVASMLQSPNRRLILSTADKSSAGYLAAEFSKREVPLRGVFAPTEIAQSFIDALKKPGGAAPAKRFEQDLMLLETPSEIHAAPGVFRTARSKDLSILVKWGHAFASECGLDETAAETEEVVRKYFENRQLFVWDVGSRPVAMAAYGGLTPKAARLSMVYTDPAGRNHGYAATLVHRLSHLLLREGRQACVLFVDNANPISKRVYEKLGYRSLATFADYRFAGSSVTTTG